MKQTLMIALLLAAWGCGSSDGSSDEPSPMPDAGMSDMMVEIDAEAPMTALTASPASLSVPTVTGERATQVNFEIRQLVVNLTRIALDLPVRRVASCTNARS